MARDDAVAGDGVVSNTPFHLLPPNVGPTGLPTLTRRSRRAVQVKDESCQPVAGAVMIVEASAVVPCISFVLVSTQPMQHKHPVAGT